jgi:hypothetical protein
LKQKPIVERKKIAGKNSRNFEITKSKIYQIGYPSKNAQHRYDVIAGKHIVDMKEIPV